MTVNYTTYDLRRGQDKINMKGRPYAIALSQDPFHPYVYARVLAITTSSLPSTSIISSAPNYQTRVLHV